MDNHINSRYKNSYHDEYKAMYEAIYGNQISDDDTDFYETPIIDIVNYTEICNRPSSVKINKADNGIQSAWVTLPDLILEKIYMKLNMKEKYYTSMVCRSWNRGFYFPNSWRTFTFNDTTLTRKLYSGWQYKLDHLRVQFCLNTIGHYIKTLKFEPITNFYNLYEFMNMITFYAEHRENDNCHVKGIGGHITNLQYVFPCNMSNTNETQVYGTGGKLLDALKRLMGNLASLKHLELVDLMLESDEALTLLDEICFSHCLTMSTLVLINVSRAQCQLLHLGVFLNLRVLVTSPQSLGEDVLNLLSETNLRHLHIAQNSYTPTDVVAISPFTWARFTSKNPNIQVHLTLDSKKDTPSLLWQRGAPVSTVMFNSRFIKLNVEIMNLAIDLYSSKLKIFGNLSSPRYYEPKTFHERMDSFYIYMCNQCSYLETLMIREKISTATILLIAHTSKKLKHLFIRRNAVKLRSDWTKNPEWTDDFYNWLNTTARSYEAVENEVSKILGYRWVMLSDKDYKRICLKLY